MPLNNKEIAKTLEEIAVLLELTGENPFKARAYERAAREIERFPEDVAELARQGALNKVPGVGEGLRDKITDLVTHGEMTYHKELRSKVPEGLFDLLRIPGLGPKRVKALYEKLGITTLSELEYACKQNNLRDLSGFGKKTEESILQGIAQLRKHQGRFRIGDALPLAEALFKQVAESKGVKRADMAGSIRRGRETVKDVDILVATANPKAARDAFVQFEGVESITADGDTKVSVVLSSGMPADLRILPIESYGAALQHFSGSKEHNVKMRGIAKKQGLKMSEWGIFKGEELLACSTEEEVYAHFDMPWIPPELREDSGEIEAAAKGKLPTLIEPGDIQGLLHVHTNWSDGSETIEKMAEACQERGFKYLAICDHSVSAAYAGGLSEEKLKQQGDDIEKAGKKMEGFRLLRGIETDIKKDGTVDYSEKTLAGLDYVVASVHSSFRMTRDEMTKRIIRAIEHPHVDGIGHPTGRLLLGRDPYEVDIEALIEAAAKHRKFLELNADPHRLDLSWPWLKAAKAKGVKICINTDAHSIPGYDNLRFGLAEARRGWLSKEDVLNAGPWWK